MLEMYSAKQGSMELTSSANQVICRAKIVSKKGIYECRVVAVFVFTCNETKKKVSHSIHDKNTP